MRITAIPQLYRNLNRWREILGVLGRYELANWLSRVGPEFAKDLLKSSGGEAIARLPWETRVRMALAELGPTFIKLGQVLSTRPDVVGVALAAELQNLQEHAPADPPEVVKKTIERELGRPVEAVFAEFDQHPMASASIGQVHQARLFSGQRVVVKVQHADIERRVAVDLEILAGLAELAERLPEFRNYRPRAVAAEFRRTMLRELDFSRELRHLQQFGANFAGHPFVVIPTPYPEYSSSRVLTMQLLEGTKLADRDRLLAAGINLDEVARRGAQICLEMIFEHGLYHCDPHPGNILVMPGDVIGLLDFGMVGRIDQRLHEYMGDALLAVANQDAELLTAIIVRVGAPPANLDRAGLALDISDFISHYGMQSLERFDLSGALTEMTEIIRRYHILLPARIAMLLKTLITLEGTARTLAPKFNLLEAMQPYRKRLLMRRMSPRRYWQKLRRLYSDLEYLAEVLPRGLVEILQQVQAGRFDIHLDHRGLEPSVNRLVLGMLASALFLGSALMLSRNVPPLLLEHISAPGAAGCTVAIALGLRLWRAIGKSGRLDRPPQE